MGQELSTPSTSPEATATVDNAPAAPPQELPTSVSTSFSVSSQKKSKAKLNVALLHETLGSGSVASRSSRKSYRIHKDENSILARNGDEASTRDAPTPKLLNIPELLQEEKDQAKEKRETKKCANERDVEILYEELLDKHHDLLSQKLKLKYAEDGSSVADMSYTGSIGQSTNYNPSILSDTGESVLTDVAHCPGGADATATSRERRLYYRRMYEEQQAIQKLALLRQMIQAEYESGDSCTSSKMDKEDVQPLLDEISFDLIERSRSERDSISLAGSSTANSRRSRKKIQVETVEEGKTTFSDSEIGSTVGNKHNETPDASAATGKMKNLATDETTHDIESKISNISRTEPKSLDKSSKESVTSALKAKPKKSPKELIADAESNWDDGSKSKQSVDANNKKSEDNQSKTSMKSCTPSLAGADGDHGPDWDEGSKTSKNMSHKELVMGITCDKTSLRSGKSNHSKSDEAMWESDWESSISMKDSTRSPRTKKNGTTSNAESSSKPSGSNESVSSKTSLKKKISDQAGPTGDDETASRGPTKQTSPEKMPAEEEKGKTKSPPSIASWSKSKRTATAFTPYCPDDDSTIASKQSGRSMRVKTISFSGSKTLDNTIDYTSAKLDDVLVENTSSNSTDSKNPVGHNTSLGDSPEVSKRSFDWSDKKSKMSIAEINDDDSVAVPTLETRDALEPEKRSQDTTIRHSSVVNDAREQGEKPGRYSTSKTEQNEEEEESAASKEDGDNRASSTEPAVPDYNTIFGKKSKEEPIGKTKRTLKIEVEEPNGRNTRPESLSIFDRLDRPPSASMEEGDVDVRFVEQYEDLFQEFLYEKPQFMDRDPELLGFLKVVKLQKILEASADMEKNLERKIEVIEHQKTFMSKAYHSQLMEASQKKARRELELEQELTQASKIRKEMEASLTWKRIVATDARAKRQQRILRDLAKRRADGEKVFDLLPDLPETELVRDVISPPTKGQASDEKDIVHYQVDNSLLLAETTILDLQSQAMFEDAKKHAWVDSIFMQMKDEHLTKLKEIYASKMGVDP